MMSQAQVGSKVEVQPIARKPTFTPVSPRPVLSHFVISPKEPTLLFGTLRSGKRQRANPS